MSLRVDFEAEQAQWRIMGGLRTVRREAQISQNALSVVLPVRGRAVCEWETGRVEPSFENLLLLAAALGQRLVITDEGAVVRAVKRRPGESWVLYERRRLAHPMRERRRARGWSQTDLGERVGMSRDTIARWELLYVAPQLLAVVVWARALDFSVGLRRIGPPDPRVRRSAQLQMSAAQRPK